MKAELNSWLRLAMLAGALLGLFVCADANAGGDLTVQAKRSGSAVAVEARATLRAPADLIWKTLTDYDHLSEFIPGMRESKMVDRRGGAAIVEQHGEAKFLVFSYGIDVVVESAEYPPDRIEIHVVSGNLRRLDGAYRLSAGDEEGTWLLRWSGLIEPTLPVPSFLAVDLMRRNVEAQFSGMVAEIERRQSRMAARPELLVSSKTW
jgi:ribosome-associated toxin RatA of RatAB toxin-antitoxin module